MPRLFVYSPVVTVPEFYLVSDLNGLGVFVTTDGCDTFHPAMVGILLVASASHNGLSLTTASFVQRSHTTKNPAYVMLSGFKTHQQIGLIWLLTNPSHNMIATKMITKGTEQLRSKQKWKGMVRSAVNNFKKHQCVGWLLEQLQCGL